MNATVLVEDGVGHIGLHQYLAFMLGGERYATGILAIKEVIEYGKLLEPIVPAIGKTSELVPEIAVASSEQSSGVGQINTTMTQPNQITQKNASSCEELEATAEEMSSQAAQLQEAMGFFKVGAMA